ncbi:MAG: DUF3793 family protein [Eubacteriales bacterium]|nr:DUF3793 family protein [Eubacteriales bacterium]
MEKNIVKYCSPALAGLKTANMFSYRFESVDKLLAELYAANEKLNEKGVFVEILRISEAKALVYVYRKKMLEADLNRKEVQMLLKDFGYQGSRPEKCLERLKGRLLQYECFPHEIGLFLGYPIQDVSGFIQQKGKNYKCRGPWKVYGNESEAKRLFQKLEKCSRVYNQLFAVGRSITQLTVAA